MLNLVTEKSHDEELLVQCPYCAHDINEAWEAISPVAYTDGLPRILPYGHLKDADGRIAELVWMYCPNDGCTKLIIKGSFTRRKFHQGIPLESMREEWFVVPRRATRLVDSLVPSQYANDYREAAAILSDSPKASAGLSRRILADLLADYGGYSKFSLSARITDFNKDPQNPPRLKTNLDYLRELGDFGAHTQKDIVTGTIVDVEPGEAEWCLDLVDRLFDYYIIEPKQDENMRMRLDEKLAQADRKPIKPFTENDNG